MWRWDSHLSRTKRVKDRSSNGTRVLFIENTKGVQDCHLHKPNWNWHLIDLDCILRIRWYSTDTIFVVKCDNVLNDFIRYRRISSKTLWIGKGTIILSNNNRSTSLILIRVKPNEETILKMSLLKISYREIKRKELTTFLLFDGPILLALWSWDGLALDHYFHRTIASDHSIVRLIQILIGHVDSIHGHVRFLLRAHRTMHAAFDTPRLLLTEQDALPT